MIDGRGLDLDELLAVSRGARVEIAPAVRDRLSSTRAYVDALVAGDVPVYGLNTGLGPRRNQRVSGPLLRDYQRQIITSHASGIGAPMPEPLMRATIAVRLSGLAAGWSGASTELVDALVALLNSDIVPIVPEDGSIGASDLPLMAGVGRVLLGRGRVWHDGRERLAVEALAENGIAPFPFAPKDALALISANSAGLASAALVAHRAEHVLSLADLAVAATMETVGANLSPFDARVFRARPFRYAADAPARILRHISGGRLEDPRHEAALQDPLSIRVVPQVHGSVRAVIEDLRQTLLLELRSGSDNPLIDSHGAAVSNGNFHSMEVTLAVESLRLALAHLAMLSERRSAKLVELHRARRSVDEEVLSGEWEAGFALPPLVGNSAAALSAEIRHLAFPVSLNVPPIGAGVEDHASALPLTAKTADRLLELMEETLTIEVALAVATDMIGDAEFEWGARTSGLRAAVREVYAGENAASELPEVLTRVRERVAELIRGDQLEPMRKADE